MLGSIKVLCLGLTCVEEISVFLAYNIRLLHVDRKKLLSAPVIFLLDRKSLGNQCPSVLPRFSLSEKVRSHMLPLIKHVF